MEAKRVITSENWMFDFGKYRGKTVSSVIDCNPGYIQWLTENDVLQFSDEISNAAILSEIAQSPPEDFYWSP
jgi:hypothetical protein